MKKITFTIAAILGFSSLTLAQDLYVSPTSYMYVQDEVVFVNDDIRLEAADSNIYLRDDAQLIQNTNTKNSDLGELSVYQQQTGSIYEYSYWASPVGVAVDGITKANEIFNVTNFHKPASTAVNEVNSAQYATTSTIYDSTLTLLSSYWIYKTINAYSYWQWEEVHSDSFVDPGYGYTMKGTPGSTPTSGNVLDFRGRPNTGTMTVPCVWSGTTAQVDYDGLLPNQVESLIGNPYPSSMDLKLLFVDPTNAAAGHSRNTFLTPAIYFWEDRGVTTHYMEDYEGGYAEYIPGDMTDLNDDGSYVRATFKRFHINGNGGGTGSNNGGGTAFSTNYGPNHARRYAAIGQGFMVRNINGNAGGNVTIDNSMRIYLKQDNLGAGGDGAIFNKSSNPTEDNIDSETVAMSHNGLDYMNIVNNPTIVPEIRIHNLINDTYIRESVLAFRANGSETNFKPGFDGRIAQKLASDSYLISDDIELSIKSIAYNIDARIPFGIVAETNSSIFSITINSLKDVSDNVDVYLYDNLNNSYTDIRNGTFDITLDAGTYNDRFEVVFKNAAQEQEELEITEEEIVSSFNVYQNNTNNVLTIKNPKAYIVKSFMMFDVTGKLIYNKTNLGNNEEYTFPTSSLSNGMYLTKVTTDQDFEITKKVMVHN